MLQPSFVRGLSVTVDYYNIKIKGAISNPTVNDVLGACYGAAPYTNPSGSGGHQPRLHRHPPQPGDGRSRRQPRHDRRGLLLSASNLGQILTDGVDLGINYRRDLGVVKLNLGFQGNWTNRSKFKATPTALLSRMRWAVFGQLRFAGVGRTELVAGVDPAGIHVEPAHDADLRHGRRVAAVASSRRRSIGVRQELRRDSASLGRQVRGARVVDFNRIPAYNYLDLVNPVQSRRAFRLHDHGHQPARQGPSLRRQLGRFDVIQQRQHLSVDLRRAGASLHDGRARPLLGSPFRTIDGRP